MVDGNEWRRDLRGQAERALTGDGITDQVRRVALEPLVSPELAPQP